MKFWPLIFVMTLLSGCVKNLRCKKLLRTSDMFTFLNSEISGFIPQFIIESPRMIPSMTAWINRLQLWPKTFMVAVCVAIVIAVGFVDYLTGYKTFFFIFYLLAVFLAVWFVAVSFGVLISALSVTAWISTNIAAG